VSAHLVTCELASGLGGAHPPGLDSLVEMRLATILRLPKLWRTDRNPPSLYDTTLSRMPIEFTRLNGWPVPHVSACVLSEVADDRHKHFHRRFPINESAEILTAGDRGMVATANHWTKSYRLPLRVRLVQSLSWIVDLRMRPCDLLSLVGGVTHLGTKHNQGYGAVDPGSWKCEARPELDGCWWFAPHAAGPVLMRPLPVGDWLPENLQGARRDFAACTPPFWHPDRFTEVVLPC
jgi:hypothetical protein